MSAAARDGFGVFSYRVSAVEAALTALSLKGVRRGLPPLTWAWGEAYRERGHDRTLLTLTGAPPSYAGWAFVACLDHEPSGTVVRALPGFDADPKWRVARAACEHCGHRRARSATFLLRNEAGEIRQVGSTCIGDFLGYDRAGQIAMAASRLAEARDMLDEECLNGGAPSDRSLMAFVSDCAYLVRTMGWLSTISELAYAAQATIEADARALAEAEAERVAKLASAPKSNPLDRKGLKQIGKTAKKKAKLAARGA